MMQATSLVSVKAHGTCPTRGGMLILGRNKMIILRGGSRLGRWRVLACASATNCVVSDSLRTRGRKRAARAGATVTVRSERDETDAEVTRDTGTFQ